MEGLTRGYAARLVKEGITVNNVAPSLIETDMMKGRTDLARNIPLGRMGQPEEVAQAVAMVLGNSYMTGQTIILNGGMAVHLTCVVLLSVSCEWRGALCPPRPRLVPLEQARKLFPFDRQDLSTQWMPSFAWTATTSSPARLPAGTLGSEHAARFAAGGAGGVGGGADSDAGRDADRARNR
jgi:hypothetical protein